MTTTTDPKHPLYFDEADVRNEMTRVFDICQGCRLCFEFCSSFPSLYELVDRFDDQDAGRLTPAEQDRVVDECFQCKLCYVNCPYTPELHPLAVDVPRLMLRADAMRVRSGQMPVRDRTTTRVMARTDALGRLGSATAPLANAVIGARPGSLVRKAVASLTGVSAVRLLPPYARQRFSTWFKKRSPTIADRRQGKVTVFPTCLVEYQATAIGKDLVRVYERNGIECSLTRAGCCGAPWLHAGDVARFTKLAKQNVKALAAEVRGGGGRDIVVPQPTCGYVLKQDYLDYVGGPDAELVAGHTYDASEYLIKLHTADATELDTNFTGTVPDSITYHAACHLRAQNVGLTSGDLLRLTGAKVTTVERCSGVDGMWGLRAGNEQFSLPLAHHLAEQIDAAGGSVVAGDCNLANTAIAEQTGSAPAHPISLVARAYGIPEA
jgi:Fe-S oxidoreductase